MTSGASPGPQSMRVVQVLGGGHAVAGAYARLLAAGLVTRGVHVTVCAPAATGRDHEFTVTGAHHAVVPRRSDPASLAALRLAVAGADVVHAHGLHAGLRAVLALGGRDTPLLVDWHAPSSGDATPTALERLRERTVARAATLVLGPGPATVAAARRSGARDVRLVARPVPRGSRSSGDSRTGQGPRDHEGAQKLRAELGATGRALIVVAAPLRPGHGLTTLLEAARWWRPLQPAPLVLVAGEGPRREALRRRIRHEDLPVLLSGARKDLAELIACADLVVIPGTRPLPPGTDASPSPAAQEALLAGTPVVAAEGEGLAGLLGPAGVLVPPGDARALATEVVALLGDPERRALMRQEARRLTEDWPSEHSHVSHVLDLYDEVAGRRS